MSDDKVKRLTAFAADGLSCIAALMKENEKLRALVETAYDEGFTDGYGTTTQNPAGDFRCSMAFAALNTGKADT
jgi:hypothetical protein